MSTLETIEKRLYEIGCSVTAIHSYEDRAVDGLIAMKIIHAISTEEATNLLKNVQLKVIEEHSKVLGRLSATVVVINGLYKTGEIDSDTADSKLNEIISIVKDIRSHVTKNEELVTDEDY